MTMSAAPAHESGNRSYAPDRYLFPAERGGEIYFITDGEPIEYKAFVTSLLRTQGLTPPDRSIPGRFARPVAKVGDATWRAVGLKGTPPLTILAVRLLGEEVTVDDAKARRELGYRNVVTLEQGLAEMNLTSPPSE